MFDVFFVCVKEKRQSGGGKSKGMVGNESTPRMKGMKGARDDTWI
jgi:hypothetical protein